LASQVWLLKQSNPIAAMVDLVLLGINLLKVNQNRINMIVLDINSYINNDVLHSVSEAM
jgi:hypothetical protein